MRYRNKTATLLLLLLQLSTPIHSQRIWGRSTEGYQAVTSQALHSPSESIWPFAPPDFMRSSISREDNTCCAKSFRTTNYPTEYPQQYSFTLSTIFYSIHHSPIPPYTPKLRFVSSLWDVTWEATETVPMYIWLPLRH